MTTALIKYQRWAVDDPVLDCAIMILDINADRLYWEAYEETERLYWPQDAGDAMMFLWDAARHLESGGKVGYIWVDEARMRAADALNRLGNILMHEREILKLLKGPK